MGVVTTVSDLLPQIDVLMSVCAIVAYTLSLVVYRLYFSPLSGFPGPKLTAATGWYVTYFQVVKDGQFWRKIPEWHEKYGPIVRISPTELHISDPEFYDTIYTTGERDKVYLRNALPTALSSTHSTVDHFLHQRRRAALSPLFSRLNIQKFIPLIQSRVDIIINRINTEYKGTDKVLNLGHVFSCYTADVMMGCSFGANYGFCEKEGFRSEFMEGTGVLIAVLHWTAHFPILAWIMNLVSALPYRIMKKIAPKKSVPLLSWLEDLRIELRAVMHGTKEKTETTQSTVFHEILKSDLPPEEKSEKRLHDEAQLVIAAGIETTQWTLTVAMFYLLDNSQLLSKLRAEILTVFPDPSSPPSLATLEKLPYLTAVVQEALRFSIGLQAHAPRVAHKPLSYTDPTTGRTYTIPTDTPLSCATPIIHYNESIFPSSHSFIPERWLSDPVTGQSPKVKLASGAEKPLTKYLLTFMKGSRQCLGMHLAYAEMYLILANFTRKCEFELWETTHEAVETWSEHNVPTPKPGTGVRVKVL